MATGSQSQDSEEDSAVADSAAPAEDAPETAPSDDPGSDPPPVAQVHVIVPPPPLKSYLRFRPLPWWLCFILGIFLLLKFELVYNESPCAVLGTQPPVSKGAMTKAFRQLSMCTHPDRLRGRLQRQPTAQESRRGEIIFNRASVARDSLLQLLKRREKRKKKKAATQDEDAEAVSIPCYEGELEAQVVELTKELVKYLGGFGVGDYWTFFMETAWSIITFEAGFLHTVLNLLWMLFALRMVKMLISYIWHLGLVRFIMAFVTTLVIGPIPTLLRYAVLPIIRIWSWTRLLIVSLRPLAPEKKDDDAQVDGAGVDIAPSTASMPVATERGLRLRQRKRRETDQERLTRNRELLTGESRSHNASGTVEDPDEPVVASLMPSAMLDTVELSHASPLKMRHMATEAIQFDMLLILTKPVIPLVMLLATGQVWNGLFSSLLIGHALRNWVPQTGYETHHLICAVFGAMHTILGVSAGQVEEHANREGQNNVLHLTWVWSYKDVLMVMHMALLGATFTAMASSGNEPQFAASFASGIALRILLGQVDKEAWKPVVDHLEGQLKATGVMIDSSEEATAYSGHGIGDCAGGPFRMLFGDNSTSLLASNVFKFWLIVLPLLCALQWSQRAWHTFRSLLQKSSNSWIMLRLVQRTSLALLGFVQCYLLIRMEINASNGALSNFWIAMLLGCAAESLLSTYDVRGPVRQVLFLLVFLFI